MIQAVVMGTGPSFYDFVKQPNIWPKVAYIGCGVVPLYFNNLSDYVIGDANHLDHLPDQVTFSPGCNIIATENIIGLIKNRQVYPWLYGNIHGGTSGGMALTLACNKFNHIGLVGFDGNGCDKNFLVGFHQLLNHWQTNGKYLYTLMSNSVFNNRLLPLGDYCAINY